MKNKKKKGFTLIELIAVIAILAILGAILVPNVLGYRRKAEKANIQSSAKTLLSAIDTYNSDKEDASSQIGDATGSYLGGIHYGAGITALENSEGTVDSSKVPDCLTSTVDSVEKLHEVADGKFTVTSVNGSSSTITIP